MKTEQVEWKKLDVKDYREIPKNPGVYLLLNEQAEVFYVGESMSLFRRVRGNHLCSQCNGVIH